MVKEKVIKDIMLSMSEELNSKQLRALEDTLRINLHGVKMEQESTEISTYSDDNDYILKLFVANKKLENKSDKSIKQYVNDTKKMLQALNKNYKDVTTDDIKYYLALYQTQHKVCPTTIANMKRFISSFYSWASDEDYVPKNPVRAIKAIKQIEKEKDFLTNEEVELMRDNYSTLREKAIFEFLMSTGLRVSELEALDIDHVNFRTDAVRVYAPKTRKYRTAYMNAKAKLALKKYLKSRKDNNIALFVSKIGAHRRLGTGSIQKELQKVAKRAELNKHVTVHLVRKTFATVLSSGGVKIQIIQELLGHADISMTARHYITVDQDDIRMAHKRCA